jgi:hypothetical protein
MIFNTTDRETIMYMLQNFPFLLDFSTDWARNNELTTTGDFTWNMVKYDREKEPKLYGSLWNPTRAIQGRPSELIETDWIIMKYSKIMKVNAWVLLCRVEIECKYRIYCCYNSQYDEGIEYCRGETSDSVFEFRCYVTSSVNLIQA